MEEKETSSQHSISAFIHEGLLIGRHPEASQELGQCRHLPKHLQFLQFLLPFFPVLQIRKESQTHAGRGPADRTGGVVPWRAFVHFPGIMFDMSSKKHSKPRLVSRKHSRPLGRNKGFIGSEKNLAKPPPDTSRIPWFPPLPKTGTDA